MLSLLPSTMNIIRCYSHHLNDYNNNNQYTNRKGQILIKRQLLVFVKMVYIASLLSRSSYGFRSRTICSRIFFFNHRHRQLMTVTRSSSSSITSRLNLRIIPSFCNHWDPSKATISALYSTSKTISNIDDTVTVTATTLYRQFKDLSIEIRNHDELYYSRNIDNDSSMMNSKNLVPISDDEFDALVRREEELEREHPEFLRVWRIESGLGQAATRSGRVGSPLVSQSLISSSSPSTTLAATNVTTQSNNNIRLKRKHLSPMLSLDNVHDEEQLHGWLRRVVKATNKLEMNKDHTTTSISILTEPKLDGVSLSVRYETMTDLSTIDDDNDDDTTVVFNLTWASTRGDGKIGQDVTAAAKQITGIPPQISLPLSSSLSRLDSANRSMTIEVRGEVVFPRSEFLRLRSEREEIASSLDKNKNNISSSSKNITANDSINNNTVSSISSSSSIISTFSNSRNAASGILLRKEPKNTEEEQPESKELQSLLRFYAYDISGLLPSRDKTIPNQNNRRSLDTDINKNTVTNSKINEISFEDDIHSTTTESINTEENKVLTEIDGARIRQQLSDWTVPMAVPVIVTEIQWNNNNYDSDNDVNDNKVDEMQWKDSLRERTIKDQIQPMVDYYTALENHRERLQNEDLATTTEPKKKNNTRQRQRQPKSEYDWGDFDMDGCVHKVSQASIKAAMGYSMKSPKWATAHKFPAQSAVSRLLDIVVQVGRTGALTPVAILEPVKVGGVTIKRATLHNFGHLKEILGGNCDDTKIPKYEPVLLRRAGDVIPQVMKRIQSSSSSVNYRGSTTAIVYTDNDSVVEDNENSSSWISLEPPKHCPACGSPVTYDTSSSSLTSAGQVMRCNGPPLLCPPRAVTSLTHAFSRDALDLTGLSAARIQQLMDAGLIRYPNDIFKMGESDWERIAALSGWGGKSCKNLRGSSEKVALNGTSLGRFIYSLGIRNVGKYSSELVASSYGTVGKFLDALDSAAQNGIKLSHQCHPFPQLESRLGIGPVMVESLLGFSKSTELTSAAKDLARSLTILEQDVVIEEDSSETGTSATASDSNQPWKGFRVVFTGSLDGMARTEAQRIAKQLGAKSTPGSVSKSTDLVVYGDKGGKKLKQAQGHGISTMHAQNFFLLAKENGLMNEDS